MSYQIRIQPETGLWIVLFDGQILGRAALPSVAINLARERVQAINDPITGRGPGSLPPLTNAVANQLETQALAETATLESPRDAVTNNPPDPQAPAATNAVALPQSQTSADADPQANQFVFDANGELVPADSVIGQDIIAANARVENAAPAPVSTGTYTANFNPETGEWDVVDLETGEIVATGLSQDAAQVFADTANTVGVDGAREEQTSRREDSRDQALADLANGQAELARRQAILQAQRKQANDGDWRVKLRLAPGADYLYRAANPGILQPLLVTDGVIFPYTPQITTAYHATYNPYELTHSNYKGYFYQGSYVGEIQIQATFTAQDSAEAEYLLAVIHFFRSVTKMFYGKDPNRGTPPPLVFLQGLGQFQFNLHPCVISMFNYNLPNDVDYIRAGSRNINGTNLLIKRDRQDLPTNIFSSAIERLRAAGLPKGGQVEPPAPPTLGVDRPSYVPTKIDISLNLLPIQSREQVSKTFSLKNFANGNLIKGGTNEPGAFW